MKRQNWQHLTHPEQAELCQEQAAGHPYYVTLDIREAYFQIMLDEESRDLTTFSDGVTISF